MASIDPSRNTGQPGMACRAIWNDPGLRIVDIRGYVKTEDLGGGRAARGVRRRARRVRAGHIPGSVFVDWTTDIVDPDDAVKAQLAPADAVRRGDERAWDRQRDRRGRRRSHGRALRDPAVVGAEVLRARSGRPCSTAGSIGWKAAGLPDGRRAGIGRAEGAVRPESEAASARRCGGGAGQDRRGGSS